MRFLILIFLVTSCSSIEKKPLNINDILSNKTHKAIYEYLRMSNKTHKVIYDYLWEGCKDGFYKEERERSCKALDEFEDKFGAY